MADPDPPVPETEPDRGSLLVYAALVAGLTYLSQIHVVLPGEAPGH